MCTSILKGEKTNMNEYLKIKDAQKYLGFKSYQSLKKLIKNGLPVAEIDGTKLISKSDIDDFMQAHKVIAK